MNWDWTGADTVDNGLTTTSGKSTNKAVSSADNEAQRVSKEAFDIMFIMRVIHFWIVPCRVVSQEENFRGVPDVQR